MRQFNRDLFVNLQSVSCGNCGASLNLPDNVAFVTCRHCGSALKVQHTASVAFTEVLQTLKDQSSRIAQNTEAIQLQNEISVLDQEWESQSAGLMIHGKHGQISVPERGSAIVGGVVVAIFGGFWTLFTSFIFPPFALFGLLFVGFGLWSSISHFSKAEQYQRLRTGQL